MRTRPSTLRAALRALSTVLIVSGTLLIADAAATVAWQEPLSALLGRINQDKAAGQLRRLERAGPTPIELRALQALPDQRRRIAFLARSLKRRAHVGEGVGRIELPRGAGSFVIVKGTSTSDLRKGPGLYPETPFPGAPGTVAIAGHRTTYLAPFRHVDRFERGDTITLKMPYAVLTYSVEGTRIVKPTDLGVLKRVGYDRLVLTACHPLYSAAKRIAVFARLERTQPRGALLRQPSAGRPRK
jgi:sortase A